MKTISITTLLVAGLGLTACTGLEGGERTGAERSFDGSTDNKHLSQLVAGVWVDPNGCDHWIIDDGVEGYLSERMQPDGRPVCSGVAPPNTAVGPFREGSNIPDVL
ncbi:hypothetical protein [Yoonia sp. MH D7]